MTRPPRHGHVRRPVAIAAGVAGALVAATVAGVATAPAAHASAPPAPTSCQATASTASNPVPVVIPGGPAVVQSTINVTGVGAYLLDVDAITGMQHTFPGDLDVTLTSPAGTVVTLTSDNAGTNDNVFDGTRWDDDANPGGQVPYSTNNGMVTDHAYAVSTPVATLTPEEPLGAFIGENPNGTWTLKISDDTAIDGGNLTGWSLEMNSLAKAPNVESTQGFSNPAPVVIPGGPAVVQSTIDVAGVPSFLSGLDVITGMQHTFPGDLDVTVTSPAGTVVTLTSDNAGTNDNVFDGTRWDDDANPAGQVPYATNNGMVTDHAYAVSTPVAALTPEEPLAAFVGENPNGTWTLKISDDTAVDGGNLTDWSMNLVTSRCDTKVDGATASAKGKQKLGKKKLAIAASVSAATEKLTVKVSGSVKISGKPKRILAKGKAIALASQTRTVNQGASASLKLGLAGNKKKAKKTFAQLRKALAQHQKLTATLTFVFTDELGNTQTITQKVKLKG